MDWHARYTQQAIWTAQLRSYLFNKAGLDGARRVLDLGCGTGVLLQDIDTVSSLYGLDISLSALREARAHAPDALLSCQDAASVAFSNSVFDVVFCHFVLLWVDDPLKVVSEMRRVTRRGGAVLALAEPDYGGRIDYPLELAEPGRWQAESLHRQGADPNMGRKLAGIFNKAGLNQVETGVLGGQWKNEPAQKAPGLEWDVLAADLTGEVDLQQIQEMKKLDERSWESGERVLYVPTFYAWGIV